MHVAMRPESDGTRGIQSTINIREKRLTMHPGRAD